MSRNARHAPHRNHIALGTTVAAAGALGLACYLFIPASPSPAGSLAADASDGGSASPSATATSAAAARPPAAADDTPASASPTLTPSASPSPDASPTSSADRVSKTGATSFLLPGQETIPGSTSLTLPGQGQAAIEIDDQGMIGSYGPITAAQPIASVTKTMTALLVLRDHPLALGQQGPDITLTAADVSAYNYDVGQNMSVVAVQAGEEITENQALQALMLASADNMADVLAAWDAGSQGAFLTEMNSEAATLGMDHTVYTDDSGYNPGSASSSADQLILGDLVAHNPYYSNLVSQTSAVIPVAGTIHNYNTLIGVDGIDGIKTGSTGQAGGCLLFMAKTTKNGLPVSLLGVVLGQDAPVGEELGVGLTAAKNLVTSAENELTTFTVVPAGTTVATTPLPWGGHRTYVTTDAVTVVGWPGEKLNLTLAGMTTSQPELRVTTSTGGLVFVQPLTVA
jgi:serine-type D-Ala-D-Ala carboxypeptidase (penicillin-binding protein 5/6)